MVAVDCLQICGNVLEYFSTCLWKYGLNIDKNVFALTLWF